MSVYLRCSTLIEKRVTGNILFFAVGINFSVLMFQIFTRISLLEIKIASRTLSIEMILIKTYFPIKKLKIKIMELSYLHKGFNYANSFLE